MRRLGERKTLNASVYATIKRATARAAPSQDQSGGQPRDSRKAMHRTHSEGMMRTCRGWKLKPEHAGRRGAAGTRERVNEQSCWEGGDGGPKNSGRFWSLSVLFQDFSKTCEHPNWDSLQRCPLQRATASRPPTAVGPVKNPSLVPGSIAQASRACDDAASSVESPAVVFSGASTCTRSARRFERIHSALSVPHDHWQLQTFNVTNCLASINLCECKIRARADTSAIHAPAEQYDYDVLILGGGMSGISAAAALHEAGKSFLVLEQAAQIGGRMRAVKFGGDIIEKGANWYDA